jgi:hypothetical protein
VHLFDELFESFDYGRTREEMSEEAEQVTDVESLPMHRRVVEIGRIQGKLSGGQQMPTTAQPDVLYLAKSAAEEDFATKPKAS